MTSYIEAIGRGFPAVQCHALGDGTDYDSLVWESGAPLPSKEALDAWIAANPVSTGVSLTRYEFRKLFTLNERVAIDNANANTTIPANYRAVLVTLMKDLELSGLVELSNPDVIAGVRLLEQVGLIATGRGDRILANLPPV